MPPHQRDYDLTRRVEVLDADLRPSEVVALLDELRFDHPSTLRTIRLDEGIRDYLVRCCRHTTAG